MKVKVVLSLCCVLCWACLQFHTYRIVAQNETDAQKREQLLAPLKEKSQQGKPMTPEEEAKFEEIWRQYPPSYFVLNRLKGIIVIQFILVLVAVGLPYARSNAGQQPAEEDGEQET